MCFLESVQKIISLSRRARLHSQWMKVSLGRSLTQVFAVQRRVEANNEPSKAHWITVGLPDDHWCCGTAQLTADNRQHTLHMCQNGKEQAHQRLLLLLLQKRGLSEGHVVGG